MNNNSFDRAERIVKEYAKHHTPQGCCCSGRQLVGPTGPTHPVKSEKYPNFISHYTNGLNL